MLTTASPRFKTTPIRLVQRIGGFCLVLALAACGGGGGGSTPTPVPVPVPVPTAPPVIAGQPANVTVTSGQAASFSVSATGSGTLTYAWQRNGVAIPGSNNATYTLATTTVADNGTLFRAVVSNADGSVTSAAATLTVNPAPVAPSVTSQPANATATVGQTASFSVVAAGSEPLAYQWQRNGQAIAGATMASYTTPVLALVDSGAVFSVVISNVAGNVTSGNATLSVVAAPVAPAIATQPLAQAVIVGQAASFSVTANGTGPLAFQWRKNGADIAGATAATYTTPATSMGDNGVSFSVVVSNAVSSVTSGNALLTVTAPVPADYWLRGEAGVGQAGSVAFASGPLAAASFNLILVNPASPSTPQVAEPGGGWALQAIPDEPRVNPQNAGDASERFIVYARGTRLWRLDLLISGGATTVPTPAQVGSVSLSALCAPGTDATTTPFFPDSADAAASVLQYRVPGADNACNTADDGFVALRVSAASGTAPTNVPRLLAALRNAGGGITGFLARQGNDIQRLDANFANPSTLFSVGAGEIELLRQPGGPGLIVLRDGNALRAFDPALNVAPVTLGTAAADFLQLGEVGTPVATAFYRNNGSILAYRLDNSGPLTPVLTLTSGQTAVRGGGDGQQLLVVVANSGGGSRLLRLTPDAAVTTLFDEAGVIDGGSVGITPTRWIYTTGTRTALRSVPRDGGTATLLAQSSELRVFNIGSWPYEAVWFDLRGSGGALFGSQVRFVGSDGSNPAGLNNASTVGGASFNGFSDTSVGRIVARNLGASAAAPYAGAELLALDQVTGGTRVVYGTLGASAYDSLDVSRLSGPDRPVLVTAAKVANVGAGSSDLYLVRVGTPGLVRVTNFVP